MTKRTKSADLSFHCLSGHPAARDERFCATCGTPIIVAEPETTGQPRRLRVPAVIVGMLVISVVATAAVRGGVTEVNLREVISGRFGSSDERPDVYIEALDATSETEADSDDAIDDVDASDVDLTDATADTDNVDDIATDVPVTPIPQITTAAAFAPAVWGLELPQSSGANWDPLDVLSPFDAQLRSGDAQRFGLFLYSDRLIIATFMTTMESATVMLSAVTADGTEIWSQSISGGDLEITQFANTIGVTSTTVEGGTGLDYTRETSSLTLVSKDDGSIVAEVELTPNPGAPLSDIQPTGAREVLAVPISGGGSLIIAEDGTSRSVPFYFNGLIRDRLGRVIDQDWYMGHTMLVDQIASLTLPRANTYILPSDAILAYTPVPGSPEWDTASETEFCATFDINESSAFWPFQATLSPNGQFGVWRQAWYSNNEIRCFGAGPVPIAGQENEPRIALTAVTDDGTAFGITSNGDFVVVQPGAEPVISPMPEGALPPIGVMSGNIAIHWDPATGAITANPITGF